VRPDPIGKSSQLGHSRAAIRPSRGSLKGQRLASFGDPKTTRADATPQSKQSQPSLGGASIRFQRSRPPKDPTPWLHRARRLNLEKAPEEISQIGPRTPVHQRILDRRSQRVALSRCRVGPLATPVESNSGHRGGRGHRVGFSGHRVGLRPPGGGSRDFERPGAWRSHRAGHSGRWSSGRRGRQASER